MNVQVATQCNEGQSIMPPDSAGASPHAVQAQPRATL